MLKQKNAIVTEVLLAGDNIWLTTAKQILRAYASVLFLKSTLLGLAVAAVTFLIPNIGVAGLCAVVFAALITKALRFSEQADGLHLFNSLLVGLAVGAFFQISLYSLALLAIGVLLCIFVGAYIGHRLWRFDRIPALSLPFVLVVFTLLFASRNFSELEYFLPKVLVSANWLPESMRRFFQTFGAIFFFPQASAGIAFLVIVLLQSRYLVFLAISGYLVGVSALELMMSPIPENMLAWSGFNFALAAMAVGGILTVPSFSSYAVAMGSALIATFVTSGLNSFLINFSFPVLAAPFVIATVIVIAGLKVRLRNATPIVVATPDLPEKNYERARLARYRNGEVDSVPLLTPFFGEWSVYQGVDGPHTHKDSWRYALDFYITKDDRSFDNGGATLDDFYCFGQPIMSPAYGTVIRCYDELKDNAPGEMDTTNNWGNIILIRLDSGLFVLLAHLRHHSIKVKEKQRVEPGDIVAACGNSGRSPQPHLHLQVQKTPELNAATHPFHLASVLETGSDGTRYRLVSVPQQGFQIEMAKPDNDIAQNLHLPVGRQLQYRWKANRVGKETLRTLTVVVTLEGEYRLQSDSGASAAFAEMNGVLAFYDRSGPRDWFLNAWLLALGLTPLSEKAKSWEDAPAAALIPQKILQRLWIALRFPLGTGIESKYQRAWDATAQSWTQRSIHTLPIPQSRPANGIAFINQQLGCYEFEVEINQQVSSAKLHTIGLLADEGIPGWTEAINVN